MRRSTIQEYDNLADMLTNLVGVMKFRFMDLCVKAEPVSLLNVKPIIEGQIKNIEDCAKVGKENDYQFMVFPNYDDDMTQIAVAIMRVHPEFKIETKSMSIESKDENGNEKNVDVKYLLLTMPVVNDDRYDVLKDGVDVIYQDCKAQMEFANNQAKAKFAQLKEVETADNLKLLDDKVEKLNKEWNEKRDNLHAEKLKEIDEAHNKWLTEKAERDRQRQEQEAARGEHVASSMKFSEVNES